MAQHLVVRIDAPGLKTVWVANAPSGRVLTRDKDEARSYRSTLNADADARRFDMMMTTLGFASFDVFVESF